MPSGGSMRTRLAESLLCAAQVEYNEMTPLSDEHVRKPLILNSKEERILQTVHDLECVTAQEITHLLFATGSRSYVRAILAKLCGGRDYDEQAFLFRFPLPRATKGTKERVYCLGAKAREVLAVEDYYRPSKFRYLSYSPILHDLTLSRFVTAVTWYCTTHPDYDLVETRMCYQLARNPPTVPVVTKGKATQVTVIPDAWLCMERVRDGQVYPLWLEIDRGTENRQKFQQLVRHRLAFVKSPQYEKMFNTKAVLLCYVTTGATPELGAIRLHNMLRWTEDVLLEQDQQQWSSLFRFSTIAFKTLYDQAPTLLEEPVWYQPDVIEPVALFDQDPSISTGDRP
jgi:hypothetical protein